MANRESTLAGRVAGEVRAEMARQNVRGTWMAKQMGMTQSAWSRRVTGDLPFDVDQLDRVAGLLDVPITRFISASADPRGQSTWSLSPERLSVPRQRLAA
jgi:cytochrome c556